MRYTIVSMKETKNAVQILLLILILLVSGCTKTHSLSTNESVKAKSKKSSSIKTRQQQAKEYSFTKNPPRIPVLVYHKIESYPRTNISITPATLDRQLKFLSNQGYRSISIKQFYEHIYKNGPLPKKPILITFDDGWKSHYRLALPVLLKWKYKAVFFINPDTVRHNNPNFMNKAEIKDLSDHNFDIESHTWSHHSIYRKNGEPLVEYEKRMRYELNYAKIWISRVSGKSVIALAYPYGFYDAWATNSTAKAGFQMAFTVNEGENVRNLQSPLLLNRYIVFNNTSMKNFASNLSLSSIKSASRYPENAAITGSSRFPVSIQLESIDKLNMHTAYLEMNHRKIPCTIKKRSDGTRIITSSVLNFSQGQYYAALCAKTNDGASAIHSWSFYVSGDPICIKPTSAK